MTPKQKYYENLADSLIEKFGQRQIEAYYAADRDEALERACRFLTPGCSVSWGGSVTLDEIGFFDAVKASDCIVYDRNDAKTPEDKKEIYRKAAGCDFYFMSSNAITLDGQLVNIDGNGNRVSSLIFGPENVIVIAGMNKVVANVDAAIDRARNMAAPPNTVRLGLSTPCAELGRCANCLSKQCICDNIVITRRSFIPNRIKVILVGEELGY